MSADFPAESAELAPSGLSGAVHYGWLKPHWEEFRFAACQPHEAAYWLAVAGEAHALRDCARNSCLATVESLAARARGVGRPHVYAVFKPQADSLKAWERWSKKWAARTKEGTV